MSIFSQEKLYYIYMSIFSENLKRLRKEMGISQSFLAEYIDVSQQCISEWENGKIEPTLSYICRIADFFDISIDILVGRKEY